MAQPSLHPREVEAIDRRIGWVFAGIGIAAAGLALYLGARFVPMLPRWADAAGAGVVIAGIVVAEYGRRSIHRERRRIADELGTRRTDPGAAALLDLAAEDAGGGDEPPARAAPKDGMSGV